MSLDITGIRNVGDFYSQHYLDTLLASDLQATLQAWSLAETEGGAKSPPKRLASLANAYFKAAARATGDPDPVTRLEEARAFHADLIDALGYYRSPGAQPIEDNLVVPTVVEVLENGRPFLWAVEAPFPEDPDEADPLSECPLPEQLPEAYAEAKLPEASWKELLDGAIFRQDHPPRWVLLLAGGDVFLIDRNKWPQGKYLHFELGVLMGRRDPKAMRAMAGLLHRDVLLPDAGQSILDKLDEQSHKHAFAVSTDLKFGVQQAIEILANEALFHKRTVSKEKLYGDPELAKQLTRECIVYLYRMLFLFYVEARGQELGVVPMGADPYRLGYSLESLRDLELVPLTTVQAREGFFLDDSLRKLFRLVQRGFGTGQRHIDAQSQDAVEAFRIPALRSALFDEARTPFLRGVKLRTAALQRVLQLLSLSKEGGKERGRISYAQLGINQLGAVYEGLLSYSGFFAQEDLYEVQAAGSTQKSDVQSYFVSAAKIGEYDDGEIVKDSRNRPVLHKRGTYLFRLAGRDREKSASYYTPEVLTACLTKYTLKERLGESIVPRAEGEPEPKLLPADEILKLTICEPAMGSGAFLNEAINQLAHKYLERKQAELGLRIPAEDYQREWQKVKYHFAVNNAYGVDLNPLATELGKVSSWLNVLQPDVDAPYLDLRLRVGNSLIGARREVFDAADLMVKASKKTESWLSKVPVKVPLGTERKPGQIYHFLVPDAGMAPFDKDKVIAELEPENVKRIKAWRKTLGQPFTAMDIKRLEGICDRIDALWNAHHKQRVQVLASVRQHLSLWGQPAVDRGAFGPRDAETCEEAASVLREPGAPGEVLKTVLDYWCSLWFWPIRDAALLPSRDEWMGDVEALLERGAGAEKRLEVVKGLAEDKRFFHWELEFAEVFADGGGMDLILGNPPWVRVEWEEAFVLADFEPSIAVKKLTAKEVANRRDSVLTSSSARKAYLSELAVANGTQSYLGAICNYPVCRGVQPNAYKYFITLSAQRSSTAGVFGLIHQRGVLDDPKGGRLRLMLVRRFRLVCRFENQLHLFNEVHNNAQFVMSVSSGTESDLPRFVCVNNLLQPSTIDASLVHDGVGLVPGVKHHDGRWALDGHKSRVVLIDKAALELFAKLYDPPGTAAQEARLPVVHSREILSALRRFALAPRRLGDVGDAYFSTVCFDETGAQRSRTVRRETCFPKTPSDWVVSGPHFHVGTPFSKTPNEGCKHRKDYTPVDLTVVPDDYLPRTNYVPACSEGEYRKRTPHWNGRPITEFFRHCNRQMVSPTGERTHIAAVVPPGPCHIMSVFGTAFADAELLMTITGLSISLPLDFFVKSTGRAHVVSDLLAQFPLPHLTAAVKNLLCGRALRLNCLTTPYAPLWEELYDAKFRKDTSANPDPRAGTYKNLTKAWKRDVAFRTPYARRQALVELDALAALSLEMTLDELLLIYRVQFPVLQQYERDTFYDQRGKIVFTVNKGLSGVGLTRKEWEQVRDAKAGDELPDWAHDQQGPFVPPFDKCDREHDMAQAYEHFRSAMAGSADAG